MAEEAAMSGGMVRLGSGEQGFRLRVEHEAQKVQNNQGPPVVAKLTRHAGNVTTFRTIPSAYTFSTLRRSDFRFVSTPDERSPSRKAGFALKELLVGVR